jgi:hypothetical protein
MPSASFDHDRNREPVSTGIVTTALLLIVGYAVVSRLIGLAFRLVVPVVLLVVLAGAGAFSNLMPDRPPSDPYRPYDRVEGFEESGSRLGDLRLRDLPGIVVDTVRTAMRGTLAFLDGVADREPAEQRPWRPGPHRTSRDRFDEASPVPHDDPAWSEPPRPWRP